MKTLLVLLSVLAVTGCGASVSVGKPDKLKGTTIAGKANKQLEKENPQIAHGKLTCDDVKYKKGASTRCLRVVDLTQGRRVTIGATVTITDTKKGGHYKIQVDKQAQEFGEIGDFIETDLATQYAQKFHTAKPTVTCPDYLKGVVGTTVTCDLKAKSGPLKIEVKVVRVDPQNFATVYSFRQV